MAFWHISNISQWFHRVKFVTIPARFVCQQYLWNIGIQLTVSCYNLWANMHCSSYPSLGRKSLWNMNITIRYICDLANTVRWLINLWVDNSISGFDIKLFQEFVWFCSWVKKKTHKRYSLYFWHNYRFADGMFVWENVLYIILSYMYSLFTRCIITTVIATNKSRTVSHLQDELFVKSPYS